MKRDKVVLPDVNLLLAYGWRSHANHMECRTWLDSLPKFATCAITELGFLRVSMSPAYRASYENAMKVLAELTSRRSATFLACNLPTTLMPRVSSYKDTTDCYLVELAHMSAYQFATLDEGILKATWTKGIAFHPFKK